MDKLITLYERISDISFWISFIEGFKQLGILAPIFLCFIEALIPALPLVAIVSFNIGVYGTVAGFIYSYIGSYLGCVIVFSFFRLIKHTRFISYILERPKIKEGYHLLEGKSTIVLFLLTCVAFTPSSLINVLYGFSDMKPTVFFKTIAVSKIIMMFSLSFFGTALTQTKYYPYNIIIAAIILLVLYLLSKHIYKKYFVNSKDTNA